MHGATLLAIFLELGKLVQQDGRICEIRKDMMSSLCGITLFI